jgi:hypothetical protein
MSLRPHTSVPLVSSTNKLTALLWASPTGSGYHKLLHGGLRGDASTGLPISHSAGSVTWMILASCGHTAPTG